MMFLRTEMMNITIKENILELLSDMFSTAYEFKKFNNPNKEELQKMLDVLSFKILYVSEFLLININDDNFEEKK